MTDTIHVRPPNDEQPSPRRPFEPVVAGQGLPWVTSAVPDTSTAGPRHAITSIPRRFPRTFRTGSFVAGFVIGAVLMQWAMASGAHGHALTPVAIVLFLGLVALAVGLELAPRISRHLGAREDRPPVAPSRVGPSAVS